jgi:hypothetical protein
VDLVVHAEPIQRDGVLDVDLSEFEDSEGDGVAAGILVIRGGDFAIAFACLFDFAVEEIEGVSFGDAFARSSLRWLEIGS